MWSAGWSRPVSSLHTHTHIYTPHSYPPHMFSTHACAHRLPPSRIHSHVITHTYNTHTLTLMLMLTHPHTPTLTQSHLLLHTTHSHTQTEHGAAVQSRGKTLSVVVSKSVEEVGSAPHCAWRQLGTKGGREPSGRASSARAGRCHLDAGLGHHGRSLELPFLPLGLLCCPWGLPEVPVPLPSAAWSGLQGLLRRKRRS